MTFTKRSLPLLLAAATTLGGCYYSDCPVQYAGQYRTQGYVEVDTAPPQLHATVETRPPKPSGDAVWVPGHYDWRDGWVWVGGQWETPRPGYVWTPPVARRTPEGRIQYHPGHFRPRDRQPPPVYREPGDVRVSVATPAAYAGTVETHPPAAPDVHTGGTVRGGSPETRHSEPRPAPEVRTGGTVRGGSPETRRPAPTAHGGEVRGPEAGTVAPRSGEVRGPEAGTAAPRSGEVRGPGAGTVAPRGTGTVRGGTPDTVALGCQLTISRAPRGGHVTIRGTGFTRAAVVKVGGTIAPVVQSDREHISFQVPRETGGGAVTVTVGDTSASCGHLSVTGR